MKTEFHDLYKVIGANIKFFRIELGWTQDELASRCSVNRAKISKIENARRDYMFSTLLEVCKALDKNLEEVIKKYPYVEYKIPF